jgi:hypothetical protein
MMDELVEHTLHGLTDAIEAWLPPDVRFLLVLVKDGHEAVCLSTLPPESLPDILDEVREHLVGDEDPEGDEA